MAKKQIYASYRGDKESRAFRAVINRCDICNDRIECVDNIETQIDKLDELNNSYLDGPKLLLCSYCVKEYLIPAYPV
jgi:uncharacterized protein with PIN domain